MQTDTSSSRSFAFARKPRWIFLHLMVAIAVTLFGVAGFWQLHRLNERREKNETIHEGLASRPIDIDLDRRVPPDFHRVRADGRYDVDEEILVRNRSHSGRGGSNILTPFRFDDGRAVIVNRGWIPPDMVDVPVRAARPPSERVVIEGILFPTEPKRPFAPDEPKTGTLDGMNRVNLPRYAKQLPYEIIDSWILLQDQNPPQDGLPDIIPPPDLSEGSHLVYAIQWFLFIAVALAVYAALLRRESTRPIQTAPD